MSVDIEATTSTEVEASEQDELTSQDPKVVELEEKLKLTLAQLAASDRKVTELSSDLKVIKENAELNAKVDYLTRTTELSSNLQVGSIDNQAYGDAAAKLKAEYEAKLRTIQQQTVAQAAAQRSYQRIEKQLKRAGYEPGSSDPAVARIRDRFQSAKTPDDLEACVDMAMELADSKSDPSKLREQLLAEMKEEQKKKYAKVDTATPSGSGGARRITMTELSKMTPAEYAKALKEGKIKL